MRISRRQQRRNRNQSRGGLLAEINVVPYIDVMLVLLVIFMVTAPLLTVGVPVDLPESKAKSLPDDLEPLELTINKEGQVFIQESLTELDKLVPRLLAIAKNRLDTRIYIRGDRKIDYGKVMQVMGLLSQAGFNKVALIAEIPK